MHYTSYVYINPKSYPRNRTWLANRLIYLLAVADRDPVTFVNKGLHKEERVLSSNNIIHKLAVEAMTDAGMIIENGVWKGKFKDNYIV